MPTLTVNGLRFHVVDEGSGTPVLLLHGFPDTSALWDAQIRALTAAGFRAVAPDLRGRGQTNCPERVEDYAFPHLISDVAGILAALDIERAHVVGHDWGAALAWAFAMAHPARVERLMVVSVGHPGAVGKPTLEALQKGWYRLLVQFEGLAEDLFQRDDWYLLRELLQSPSRDDEYIAILSQPGALTAGFNWYRANLPPERILGASRPLPKVHAPTLGIFGAHDLYLTEGSMLRSEAMVDGPWRYERFDDAGHWVSLDEPERFNALLLEFLSGAA